MRIIVHAGLQKTGSSAIQHYLASNREALAEIGIIYPDFGHRAHFMVAAAMHDRPDNYGHANRGAKGVSIDTAVRQVRASLAATIATAAPDQILLLSHEDLATQRIAANLKSFLDERSENISQIDVVAYVRHPRNHYPSAIQQILKSGKMRDLRPGVWQSQHLKRAAAVRSVFGDRVQLRLYGPPSQETWDVVADFRATLATLTGRDIPPQTESPQVNSSLSAQACAVLAESAWTEEKSLPTRVARQNVRTFDEHAEGRRLAIPETWEAAILEPNAQPWNALLGTMDITPEEREAATIPVAPADHSPTEDEFVAWLRTGLDADYLAGFAAYCRSDAVRDKGSSKKVADWAETLGRA